MTLVQMKQKGMVLLVALVMVALMSLIAVAAIRGSNMQEAMAGNLRDRNIAFQAAEAGLRTGEKNVEGSHAYGDISTSSGYYTDILASGATTSLPVNWSSTFWNNKSVSLTSNTIPGVYKQPQVVHEQINVSGAAITEGGGIDYESLNKTTEYQFYRITSRGVGLTENTQVILQSTFVR